MVQLVLQLSKWQTVNSGEKIGGSTWKWQAANHNLTCKIIVAKIMTIDVVLELLISNCT